MAGGIRLCFALACGLWSARLASSATRCAQDGSDYSYTESVSGTVRTVTTNHCPNHPWYPLNPNYAVNSRTTYSIPAKPTFVGSSSSSSTTSAFINLAAKGGAVGVFFNAAQLFSPYGGPTYGTTTGFTTSATYAEGNTFDQCGCHASSTTQPSYHCHVAPSCLLRQLGQGASAHSPQIGWAFDGFPVYGPRGPNGVMMKTCTVTGGTYGRDVCTDDCGGYYRNDGTIDNFVYRYYVLGDYHDGTSCALPGCPSPANSTYFPNTMMCFRGCCPSGMTCHSSIKACSGTTSNGYLASYAASVPSVNGLSLASGLPKNSAACACSSLACSATRCSSQGWRDTSCGSSGAATSTCPANAATTTTTTKLAATTTTVRAATTTSRNLASTTTTSTSSRRSTYFGVDVRSSTALLTDSAKGCSNNNTCDPSVCLWANGAGNSACSIGSNANITDVQMQQRISQMVSKTCTQSTDVRCSSAALAAVFGRFSAIKAAYCNDAFMVLHSTDLPNHGTSLGSIHTPPGGGDGGQYASQCVTRSYYTQHYVFKWPVQVSLLSTSSGTVNNADGFKLASDNLATQNQMSNMPTSGPASVSVSGIPWFPNMNNVGGLTWSSCEVDVCNAHAGKGFDYHYHGDPFGPQCLYSAANYSSTGHPPLVGYGLDGVPIFGRYLFSAAPGFSVALDDCGGHQHAGMGDAYISDNTYHYHSFVMNITTNMQTSATDAKTGTRWSGTTTYTAHANGPYLCWKGNISAIQNFWTAAGSGYQPSYGAGNLAQRTDYVQVQPCTGMTNYYAASGYSIPGAGSRAMRR